MGKELKIVMCGCHEYGYYLTQGLIEAGVRFSHFVVLNPQQNERYQISGYHYLADVAQEHGIPVYEPTEYSLQHSSDLGFFAEHRFDLLIQGGWQRLFPQAVLDTLSIGAVGVHGSADLLPKGRGRSPLNWSLIEGKKRFLLQLFLMKPGTDDGDIFDYDEFDINEYDNIRTLYFKNIMVTKRMLLRSLPSLASGSYRAMPQLGMPSYYTKRTPEDGLINWETMDVFQIHNLIRATTRPYPGAFGILEGDMCRIWKAQIFDTRILYPSAAYGDVVERFGRFLVVNCLGGLLGVEEYEPMHLSEA